MKEKRQRITLSLTAAEARNLLFMANMGSADIDAFNESDLKGYELTQRDLDAMSRGLLKLKVFVNRQKEREQKRKANREHLKLLTRSFGTRDR